MPSPYNDVELTDDEKQAIYEDPGFTEDQNPLEAGVDGVPTKDVITHETDSQEESTTVETEGVTEASESDEFNLEDYEVEIEGVTYDGADILKWQKDSANNESWQKSNTEKAQDIAKWSKFTDKVSSDEDFKEYIKDYFYDDDKGLKSLGLDGDINPLELEESETETAERDNTPVSEFSERLENIEIERAVDNLEIELDEIVSNNKTLFEDDAAEIDFLEFVEATNMTDLDDAFKIWAYDQIQDELDHHRKLDGNKQRNQGKVVHNSEIGATEVSTPKAYKSIKDINYDDPDVRKYFDN